MHAQSTRAACSPSGYNTMCYANFTTVAEFKVIFVRRWFELNIFKKLWEIVGPTWLLFVRIDRNPGRVILICSALWITLRRSTFIESNHYVRDEYLPECRSLLNFVPLFLFPPIHADAFFEGWDVLLA